MRLVKILRKIWKYKTFDFRKVETRKRNARFKRTCKSLIAREGKCRKCGTTDNLTIDHIVPISKGGSKRGLFNLQVLCEKCNQRKADLIINDR